jgi:AcrR family transcriptional regulator
MVKLKKSATPTVPPRRGAPLKGEPGARERILKTASELFYREGIRAVGIDTVVAESGVSKASLYRSFDSKDELIAAFVAERDRSFWLWWDETVAKHADDPRRQLDTLLVGVAGQIKRTTYRGCPFLNAAAEFPDEAHPGRVLACANKEELLARLTALCGRIGVSNPERDAAQLFLLINGAYAAGQMIGNLDLADNLVDAARRLIDGSAI